MGQARSDRNQCGKCNWSGATEEVHRRVFARIKANGRAVDFQRNGETPRNANNEWTNGPASSCAHSKVLRVCNRRKILPGTLTGGILNLKENQIS